MTNKTKILLSFAIIASTYALSGTTLERSGQEPQISEETKSVAWYVANIQAARAKNKECFGNSEAKELQATPNCVNSLQALNMSYLGGNQPISRK